MTTTLPRPAMPSAPVAPADGHAIEAVDLVRTYHTHLGVLRRRKIGMPDLGEHDYAFLTAYYNAARVRMERGLLFGKRKLDKYDTGSGTGA